MYTLLFAKHAFQMIDHFSMVSVGGYPVNSIQKLDSNRIWTSILKLYFKRQTQRSKVSNWNAVYKIVFTKHFTKQHLADACKSFQQNPGRMPYSNELFASTASVYKQKNIFLSEIFWFYRYLSF